MKTFLKFTFVMLLASLVMACGDSLTWTEDVKLPDGRVVTLKRWVELNAPHAMGDTPNESRQRFEFKHPDTGTNVVWENARENGALQTIALMIHESVPMLITEPALGGDYRKFQCPNPPYLLHEYVNGQWRRKSLTQVPLKTIRSNMTTYVKLRRPEIETSKYKLSVVQTFNSYTSNEGGDKIPYIINFESMPTQTFEDKNCDQKLKRLILGTDK